jgi:S1-C subfamily serine protease
LWSNTAAADHKAKVGKFQIQIGNGGVSVQRFALPNDRVRFGSYGNPTQRFVLPGDPIRRPQPTLGFYGHIDQGIGMHVERVVYGSLAEQIGLQSGDVILAINGRRITCEHDYILALEQAWGRTTMVVRDGHGRGDIQVVFQMHPVHYSQPTLYSHSVNHVH